MATSLHARVRPLVLAGLLTGVLGTAASVTAARGDVPAPAAPVGTSEHAWPGAKPSWATPANDLGDLAAGDVVLGQVVFSLRDPAGAEALATAVSTPGGPDYRHPLTPTQWIDRFSPDKAHVDAVAAWLRRGGLIITGQPRSRLYLAFKGSAADVDAAFGAGMRRFTHQGRVRYAPSETPTMPSAYAGSVSALSLVQPAAHLRPANTRVPVTPGTSQQQRVSGAGAAPAFDEPCSDYWGQHTERVPAAYGRTVYPTYICGYRPQQIRAAYGVDTLRSHGVDGRGLTIAFTDAYASPTLAKDVDTFSSRHGDPPLTGFSQIVPDVRDYNETEACGGEGGWQGEQTLDATALHGVAPRAKLLYVGGVDCDTGLESAVSTVLDLRLADVVSNSWGAPDALVDGPDFVPGQVEVFTNLTLQAAAEGIGLYFCSGDEGDGLELDGVKAPWFPASLPFATSVGGTSLGVDARGKVVMETGWGTTYDFIAPDSHGTPAYTLPLPGDFGGGSGGGRSTLAAEPAYQKTTVPSSLAQGRRTVPDISAVADGFTGLLVGIRPVDSDLGVPAGQYAEVSFGGTSVATPVTAAQALLAEQASGQQIGFANPALYRLHDRNPGVFRDVRPSPSPLAVVYGYGDGTAYLVGLDHDSSLRTRVGYDDVTGLGSATAAMFQGAAAMR
jgi:subtilase family serine protease